MATIGDMLRHLLGAVQRPDLLLLAAGLCLPALLIFWRLFRSDESSIGERSLDDGPGGNLLDDWLVAAMPLRLACALGLYALLSCGVYWVLLRIPGRL
jgi:hypothetical protein